MNNRFRYLYSFRNVSKLMACRGVPSSCFLAMVVWGCIVAERACGQGVVIEMGSAFDSQQRKAEIREALSREVTMKFQDVPLDEVARAMTQELGFPVLLKTSSLEDIGLDPKTQLSADMNDISLGGGLRQILGELDLTYITLNDALMIVTDEDAERNLTVDVYDVSDFVDAHARKLFDSYAHRLEAISEIAIVEVIKYTVYADSWDDVGGPGSIEVFMLGDSVSLIISQTEEVHEGVRDLLDSLRKGAQARMPDSLEPSPQQEVDDERASSNQESLSPEPANSQPALKQLPDRTAPEVLPVDGGMADETITRIIRLHLIEGVTSEDVLQFVRAMTPSAEWDKSGNHCGRLNNTLIVRNRDEVIAEVESLLRDLERGLERPSLPGGGTGIHPSGFGFSSMPIAD